MLDQNQILEMTKKDMMKSLESLSFENISEQKALVSQYFEFLGSLQTLMELKNKHSCTLSEQLENEIALPLEDNKSRINIERTIESSLNEGGELIAEEEPGTSVVVSEASASATEPIIEDIKRDRKMYFFERKALGGFIPELKSIVPESIVVKLGLEHSDYVFADELPQTDGYDKKKYLYELAKKGNNSREVVRIQYNLCPVEKNGSLLMVSKSYNTGTIRIDDVPQSLVLCDQDIQYFGLQEGQLIDVAYIKGKENAPRVLYRHPVESFPTDDSKKTQRRRLTKDESKKDEEVEQTLEGKTVLVIGNEPDKALYKQNVEERGGDFLWADGKDPVTSFDPLVRKSDVVVFLLAVSSHTAMKHVKRLCKDYEVPFQTTFNISSTTIIRLAENCESAHA